MYLQGINSPPPKMGIRGGNHDRFETCDNNISKRVIKNVLNGWNLEHSDLMVISYCKLSHKSKKTEHLLNFAIDI